MTTLDHLSLFDAMDVVADLLRTADPNYSPADDQLIFRRLQKQRLPGLDREQFQCLFAEWQERYCAKCAQDRIRARDRIRHFAEEQAKKNPSGPPFKCVCGAEGDPFDAEYERVHRPHVFVAGLDRLMK